MNPLTIINGLFGASGPSMESTSNCHSGVAHHIFAQIDRLSHTYPSIRSSLLSIRAGIGALAKLYYDAISKQLDHEQTIDEQMRTIESKNLVIEMKDGDINALKVVVDCRDERILQLEAEKNRLSGSITQYEELVEMAWEEFAQLKEVAAEAQADLETSEAALKRANAENERLITHYNDRQDKASRRERAVLHRNQVLRNQIYELEKDAEAAREADCFHGLDGEFNVHDGLGGSMNMVNSRSNDDSGFSSRDTGEPEYEPRSEDYTLVSPRSSQISDGSRDAKGIREYVDVQLEQQPPPLANQNPKASKFTFEYEVEDELLLDDISLVKKEDETYLEMKAAYEEIERQQRYDEEIESQRNDPYRPRYRSSSQSSYGSPRPTPCSTPDLMSHNDTYSNCLSSVENWVGEKFIKTENDEEDYRIQISEEQKMRWASTDIPRQPRNVAIEKRKRWVSASLSDVDDNGSDNERHVRKRQRI